MGLEFSVARASQSLESSATASQWLRAASCGAAVFDSARAQLELLADHGAYVVGGGHRLEEGQQLEQLGVARVVEPALDGDPAHGRGEGWRLRVTDARLSARQRAAPRFVRVRSVLSARCAPVVQLEAEGLR